MRATLLLLALASASSGCNSVKCGPGTYAKGDDCVGYDPSDHTPPMTMIMPGAVRSRAAIPDPVTLVASEAATVYYTTDGTDPDPASTPPHRDMAVIRGLPSPTTLKFFSIDTAGNREDVQTATFVQDITGPAPVTNMAVTITGTTAHVTWTNPTDSDWTGTAVARVADVVDGAPTDGEMAMVSDAVTPSLQVVSTGTATSFDDVGLKPGTARYVAWAYDDLGNYSGATAASADLPLGSRTAVLAFDTATSMLTFTQQPADFDISATTATLSGTALTVALSVKNKSAAWLQNPKAEITSVTGATVASQDGTADTFPFKSLGANALAPAATATSSLTFTTTGTTVTINLAIAAHPSLVLGHGESGRAPSNGFQLADGGTSAPTTTFSLASPGPGGRVGGRARAAVVVGKHFVDVPTTHGAIERFDLATGKAAGIAAVSTNDVANVQGLVAVNGGELAIVKLASKGYGRYNEDRFGPVQIVKLDEGMHVLKTANYTFVDSSGACQPAVSPDGSTVAVASDSLVALVDVKTLAQIDADPTTPDPDVFAPASTGRIGTLLWLDNNTLFVLTRRTGQAALIKRSGNSYTTSIVYNDHTTTQGGFGAAVAPDGKVWMSFPASVQIYDPSTNTVTPLAGYTTTPATGTPRTSGVGRIGNDIWIIHGDRMGADRVDATGAILQTITIPVSTQYGYSCSPYCNGLFGHWMGFAQ